MLPLKTFILAVFVSLFWGSQVFPLQNGWREIFPFFHWSLFSTTAREEWHYLIYFPDEQCELKNCPSLAGKNRELEMFWPVQELGMSYEQNSPAFRELKNQLEELLSLKITKRSYELRLRKVYPVDYILKGEVREEKVVQTFRSEE